MLKLDKVLHKIQKLKESITYCNCQVMDLFIRHAYLQGLFRILMWDLREISQKGNFLFMQKLLLSIITCSYIYVYICLCPHILYSIFCKSITFRISFVSSNCLEYMDKNKIFWFSGPFEFHFYPLNVPTTENFMAINTF